LQGLDEAWAMAADTDGIDGSEDNAGAFMTPDSVKRASSKGLDAKALLAKHDSYGFFSALGDLLVTGPTRTNVNDYRAIVLAAARGNGAEAHAYRIERSDRVDREVQILASGADDIDIRLRRSGGEVL